MTKKELPENADRAATGPFSQTTEMTQSLRRSENAPLRPSHRIGRSQLCRGWGVGYLRQHAEGRILPREEDLHPPGIAFGDGPDRGSKPAEK